MKRSMTILLALALVLSLGSCTFLDDLLSVNLFAETFELSTADVEASSVEDLLVQSESEAFYDTLEADSEAKTALLDKTSEVLDDPEATPVAVQEAGILGANVLIYTSPAGDLLAKATGLADAATEDIATMEDLLDLIMPASVYSGDEIAEGPFVDMINAFVDANVYYIAIGDSLDPALEGDDLSSSASAGDLAVGAYIAAALDGLTNPNTVLYPTMGDYLFAALTDTAVLPPDFEAPDTTTGYLANILNAANLGSLLNL